jgi:uncharacterized protein
VEIFVFHNGQQVGPFSGEEVSKRLIAGEFFPTDLAWYEGLASWVPLSEVQGLQSGVSTTLPPVIASSQSSVPRVWTVFVSYGITLGIYVLANIILVVAAIALSGGNPNQLQSQDSTDTIHELISKPKVFLPIVFAGQCLVFASAIICAALSKTPIRERLSIRSPQVSLSLVILFMLGSIALSQGFGAVMSLLQIEVDGTIKMLSDVLNKADASNLALMVLIIGVTPGICEELFFRGYIQTRLTQRWGVKISILSTTILFAVFHLDVMQGIFVILIGLYFGLALEKTGSLWIPILCHTATNVSATLISWAMQDVKSSWMLDTSVLIISLAVAGTATWKLWKLPYFKSDSALNSERMAVNSAPA